MYHVTLCNKRKMCLSEGTGKCQQQSFSMMSDFQFFFFFFALLCYAIFKRGNASSSITLVIP